VKYSFLTLLLVSSHFLQAQINADLVAKIDVTNQIPTGLLASKSVVLYSAAVTADLQTVHNTFIRLGVDAVAYYEQDVITAGKDVSIAFAAYFNSRNINHFIFFDKAGHYATLYVPLGVASVIAIGAFIDYLRARPALANPTA